MKSRNGSTAISPPYQALVAVARGGLSLGGDELDFVDAEVIPPIVQALHITAQELEIDLKGVKLGDKIVSINECMGATFLIFSNWYTKMDEQELNNAVKPYYKRIKSWNGELGIDWINKMMRSVKDVPYEIATFEQRTIDLGLEENQHEQRFYTAVSDFFKTGEVIGKLQPEMIIEKDNGLYRYNIKNYSASDQWIGPAQRKRDES